MAGKTIRRGWMGFVLGMAVVCALASGARGEGCWEFTEAGAYEIKASGTSANWTTNVGWSGNVNNSYADGSAKFDATGDCLIFHFDGIGGTVRFWLQGYKITGEEDTGMPGFVVSLSATGNSGEWTGWNLQDYISEEEREVEWFCDNDDRYLKFEYGTKRAWNIALKGVQIEGAPAKTYVSWANRQDGFKVAQGAVGETIRAVLINPPGGSYSFGTLLEEFATPAWSSDNAGTWNDEHPPRDVFTIDTSTLGDFTATAYGRGEDVEKAEDIFPGTIHFSVVPGHVLSVGAEGGGTLTAWVDQGTNAVTGTATVAEGATVQLMATPDAGWGLEQITLNGTPITGGRFTMPPTNVDVRAVFSQNAEGAKTVIISQYYEGKGQNKWIELFNPGDTPVDLGSGLYRLGIWSNGKRTLWHEGEAPTITIPLTNTIAAGGTLLIGNTSATEPAYALENRLQANLSFNGDDTVILYTGTLFSTNNIVDAFAVTDNTAADTTFIRAPGIEYGTTRDFDPEQWVQMALEAADNAAEGRNERLGFHRSTPLRIETAWVDSSAEPPALVFEIPATPEGYGIEGADSVESVGEGAGAWNWSNICDRCTVENAGAARRVRVPLSIGDRQMVRFSLTEGGDE